MSNNNNAKSSLSEVVRREDCNKPKSDVESARYELLDIICCRNELGKIVRPDSYERSASTGEMEPASKKTSTDTSKAQPKA